MKRLNITKEAFEKSKYFQKKYGTLEYVSESGKIFKTSKGNLLKFNEGERFDKFKKSAGNFLKNTFTRTWPKKGARYDMWHYYSDIKNWAEPQWADAAGEPVWWCKCIDSDKSNDTFVVEVLKLEYKNPKHKNLKVGDCMYFSGYVWDIFIVDDIDGKKVSFRRPTQEELKKLKSTKEERKALGVERPEDIDDPSELFTTSESTENNDFVIEDGVLLKYYGDGGDVVIPKGVKSIEGWAFNTYEGGDPTSMEIPSSVTRIEDFAFEYCDCLTSVTIPNSVTYLGGHAFSRCHGLMNVTIGSGVNYIGEDAFYEDDNIKRILVKGKTQAEAEDMLKDAVDDISIVKGELG